jgi:hypothetical protein
MGVSAVELQDVLARFASNLHWLEVPRYVEPAGSGTGSPTGSKGAAQGGR